MLLPIKFTPLALCAALLSVSSALSPSDVPADTPISQLLEKATSSIAAGKSQDALTYYDIAISRDPSNYLTFFKRGAAYLSLGRHQLAQNDFDRVLTIKPGFEGALTQRAKLRSRNGKWAEARKDYETAGKKDSPEYAELDEAEGAERLAYDAGKKGDWEACVANAGTSVLVAGLALDLRKLRARCRFEKGEVAEGVSDLQHVLQIGSASLEPHLQISAMTFYSLGETEKGLNQIRKCLQSDPDAKACMKLMKREKAIEKQYKKVCDLMEKNQFNSATKILISLGEDKGLLQDVKDDFAQYKTEGLIHAKSPEGLYANLVETTCEAYVSMNSNKKGLPYCVEALQHNPTSLYGLLSKARKQIDADDFEDATRTLNEAKEHHPNNQKLNEMLNEAQNLLKRSKQKDYYKVLGVPRDADERDIKRAYRKLSVKFHPDKAAGQGFTKEEAEKKMASINEAYEVLSDPELKQRFDNGDDPNNPEQQQGGHPFQGSPFGGQQFVFRQGGGFPGGGGGFPGGGQFKFQQGGGGGFPFGF